MTDSRYAVHSGPDALQRQMVHMRKFSVFTLRDPKKAATSMPATQTEPSASAPGSACRGSTPFTPKQGIFTPKDRRMAPSTQAESAPSARRARMPLAASAGAPGRPRTSGAMRRPLLLRHTTRTRRHAREQSRLCSCAKEVLRTPRHCQVVGNTRGDASLVEREHQGHQPHASRPLEGSAGHVDAGLAGAPPSVCSRATRRNA